jgi:hypothetical protein
MSTTKAEKQEAIDELRKTLKPGDTVHTVLRHVSHSGMSRRIDLYKLQGSDALYLTGLVAKALELTFPSKGNGLRVNGCGMDMGFHLVYELSYRLWPKGDGKTVTGRNGTKAPETDGGYLLRHRWL